MRIRRGLTSRLLPCGCIAGIYETYRDEIIAILDARSPDCVETSHVTGNMIPGLDTDDAEPRDPHDPSPD